MILKVGTPLSGVALSWCHLVDLPSGQATVAREIQDHNQAPTTSRDSVESDNCIMCGASSIQS
jgi:hypothetical protein